MDIKTFKEKIGAMEGGEELLQVFQDHDNSLRADIEKAKDKKGEVVSQKSEIETVLTGLLDKLQAKTPDESNGKISEFETKLSEALSNMDGLTEKFNQSEAEKATAKAEAEKALLNSGIIEAISNKKLNDKGGMIRDTMTFRAKKDDDSGDYLIDGKNFEDFLQGQIDAEIPQFKTKPTKEELPSVNDDAIKAAATREAMGLPPIKE
ncbi:MAG: hypothetical protein GY928_37520 [Colwellia sp.]|nr:hypothetical protein [Colwellia sp.]